MSLRAQSFARRVHQRLCFERPPVSPALLIAYAPIDVLTFDWPMELAAVLVLRESRAVIGLNARHPPAIRHFSFWHEVGHYLLHRGAGRAGTPCASGWSCRPDAYEREANAFAAEVTMPREWVAECAGYTTDVAALARRFRVSQQAMARRIRELGLA